MQDVDSHERTTYQEPTIDNSPSIADGYGHRRLNAAGVLFDSTVVNQDLADVSLVNSAQGEIAKASLNEAARYKNQQHLPRSLFTRGAGKQSGGGKKKKAAPKGKKKPQTKKKGSAGAKKKKPVKAKTKTKTSKGKSKSKSKAKGTGKRK